MDYPEENYLHTEGDEPFKTYFGLLNWLVPFLRSKKFITLIPPPVKGGIKTLDSKKTRVLHCLIPG